jgi:hypothetical protein
MRPRRVLNVRRQIRPDRPPVVPWVPDVGGRIPDFHELLGTWVATRAIRP